MPPIASLIIPTFNRCPVLLETLERLLPLGDDVETIVADNGSSDDTCATLRRRYPQVRLLRLERNLAAAARNLAARQARSDLLVMLDDDSHLDREAIERMRAALAGDPRLAVAAARVRRTGPAAGHETGGLPGVFVGCGAGIRRSIFLNLGGYPEDYEFYVEEYDLCCRMWIGGWRIHTFWDIVVEHRRVEAGRDLNRVLRLLVRNNLRLWDRYAPPRRREELLAETVERYRRIAEKENALAGYEQGLREADRRASEGRRPGERLTEGQFDTLYGLTDARRILTQAAQRPGLRRVGLYGRAKGAEQIVECIGDAGLSLAAVFDEAAQDAEAWRGTAVMPTVWASRSRLDALVCGSLSPGTCLDLAARARLARPDLPVLEPVRWRIAAATAVATS